VKTHRFEADLQGQPNVPATVKLLDGHSAAGGLSRLRRGPVGGSGCADGTTRAEPCQWPGDRNPEQASSERQACQKELFEEAMHGYEQAAALDPDNANYPLAASVARNHAVTALIQAAAKDRMRGDGPAARAALAHALELDPKNIQVSQHLYELGDDALLGQSRPLYEQGAETAGEGSELAPAAGVHSFHLRTGQRQIFDQVFKSYGIQATVDESLPALTIRLDVDNVGFETAARLLELETKAFYVPLDAHRVLVVRDTPDNRQKYMPLQLETIYLPGLSATELTEVSNLAKNVFEAPQAVAEPTAGTITLRAADKTLKAFNATMRDLLDGRSQVLLDVRVIQIAHNQRAQHRSPVAAKHGRLQCRRGSRICFQCQSEHGPADHLLRTGPLPPISWRF
jgi:tetratricopeptide (TPR) repeat protein